MMNNNHLLISDVIIKDRTPVHANVEPQKLYPTIKLAQDMYILPMIGTGLFNKLKTITKDNTINTDETLLPYKTLMDDYIIDALMYYTLSELPSDLSYQFWNKGVMRKSDDNATLPTDSEMEKISNKNKARAEFYATRAKHFIMSNPELYPEYFNPGNTFDTIAPKRSSYTCPIVLDDEGRGCQIYTGIFPNKPYSP